MPGRFPYQVVSAFAEPIQRAATQVIDTDLHRLLVLPVEKDSDLMEGTKLKAKFRGPPATPFRNRPDVTLDAALELEIIRNTKTSTSAERYRLTTRQYIYTLRVEGRCHVGWHWHPDVEENQPKAAIVPHLHVYEGDMKRLHLTTGRVTIEDILLFAIHEFGLDPRDGERGIQAIEETRAEHIYSRTWHNNP